MKLWLSTFLCFIPFGASQNGMVPFSIQGRCQFSMTEDQSSIVYQYLQESGFWNFHMVPNTEDNQNIQAARLQNMPTGNQGQYYTEIYANVDGVMNKLVSETATIHTNGVIHVYPTTGSPPEITIVSLDYAPGKWFYYYSCLDNSGQENVHARFLLVKEGYQPTQEDFYRLQSVDQRYNLHGDLKQLN